ncbi:MAG: hypothetical protein JO037_10465 [Actinobacteria bacterium]|nr:hypothetical protein [Actinomycetota bacterium]
MSVGARPETAGSSAANAGPVSGAPDAAGRLLGRLSVLPALLVMSWLLAGFPLLLIGHFTPVLTLALSVPVAAVLIPLGLRWIPAPSPGTWPARGLSQARTPWWSVAAVLAVAVAFGADQVAHHSQEIIIFRDPASYFQFAEWISRHGSLPIPQDRAAFGDGIRNFSSLAYYQVGHAVVPQFMAGLPMVLAGTIWIGGANAALLAAPVLGVAALLAFGGLTARLVGPRWAPLAVLALALSLPEQFTSRSDYSEPLAQILFLGGLCLVIDSLARDGAAGDRVLAAIAGLALGLTVLVRIDGASDILPTVPYCGLLLLGRRRQALPLIGGVTAGAAYGTVDGLVLSRPYLETNKSSLVLLAVAAAVVLIATLAALPLLHHRGLPEVKGRWLPDAASAMAVLVVVAFAVRPLVQTVRSRMPGTTEQTIASYERANHLPVDPTRTFAEQSLHWVFWYVGVPAVILATVGAALLARRCVRGQAPFWTLPLMTFAWTIVTVLYRPAITPDHPWASRRLVPAVLPGVVLLAVWASSWLVRWLDEHGYAGVSSIGSGIVLAVGLVLPPAITTFGLGVRTGGPLGVTLTAGGLGSRTTYGGELSAVNGLCAAIPEGSSVIIVDGPIADHFTEIIRGMCGDPAARITPSGGTPDASAVEPAVRSIQRAGRRPVLLAAEASELRPYHGLVRNIMTLSTMEEFNTLMTPPLTTKPLKMSVWMWEPAP